MFRSLQLGMVRLPGSAQLTFPLYLHALLLVSWYSWLQRHPRCIYIRPIQPEEPRVYPGASSDSRLLCRVGPHISGDLRCMCWFLSDRLCMRVDMYCVCESFLVSKADRTLLRGCTGMFHSSRGAGSSLTKPFYPLFRFWSVFCSLCFCRASSLRKRCLEIQEHRPRHYATQTRRC